MTGKEESSASIDCRAIREIGEVYAKMILDAKSPEEESSIKEEFYEKVDVLIEQKNSRKTMDV